MEKFNKLSRDTRPLEQPKDTYPFAKNGIQDYIKGASINELGFQLSAASIPYKIIGALETDKYPVIFSSNNSNSAIGYYNTDTDSYTPILDDATLPFKIPFDTNHPITGQVQRNYKGELVGAFTDKNGFPFYLNFDNPSVTTLNDMKLFPSALPPAVKVTPIGGGTLLPGSYYAAVKYLKKDGMEVGYLTVSAPKVISGTLGTATDQGLQIDISSIDADYDYVQIAIISKINGVISAVQLVNPVPAIATMTIVYSGAELTEAITLEEILTPRKIYNKVQTIGQLNDSLYIMGLEERPRVNMQKWVNLIRLKWHSKLITVEPVYTPMATGEEKSFMHKEVYSFFISFDLTDGTSTDGFVIPGPALISADRATSTPASAEGITTKVFQVEDTIPAFDFTTKSGYFGKWENATETYPDTDDFDSSAIGGENLRGQKVRHFRFPSIAWCKQNLYQGEPGYGRNTLDMLGISVENVIIPSQYASLITGWKIYYGKRNLANSTVIGQSQLLFGGRNKTEVKYSPNTYYSTGGNWSSFIDFKTSGHDPIYIDQSIFRFHSFDMLFNKPSISPDYISLELKQSRVDIYGTKGQFEDGNVNSPNDGPIGFKLDYIQNGTPPLIPSKRIKAIKNTSYIPNNILLGKWKNQYLEGCFGGLFSNPEDLLSQTTLAPSPGDGSDEIRIMRVQPNSREDQTTGDALPYKEFTFLANMMAIRSNMFAPFSGQSFVRAGSSVTVLNSQIFFGGDTYICDYSVHTYGWFSASGTGALHDDQTDFEGTKVVRRFICECASNLYSRYEDAANVYSRYYPKSSLVPNDKSNYLTNFQRSKDPNQFAYSKDSNALDDLLITHPYNTYSEDIYQHPYRIHRGGKLSKQTKNRNWRTFLPLDYYEFQKNMGLPIHIEGMDDRLIIHMENAMFLTQDKTKLETDIIAVTLGSGDIFQFQPQEAMSAKLGYAGTQHELACIRTPFGYVSIDSKEGQMFIYKGQLETINNNMNTFFKEFLRLKETNVFMGNGYTIGYDPKYKRLLLTVKNVHLTADETVVDYRAKDVGSYTVGQIVRLNGRLTRFLGVNSSKYSCPDVVHPDMGNRTISIVETTAPGTIIGILSGTNVQDYYIDGDSTPFTVNPSTGAIILNSALDYYVKNTYTFNGHVVSVDGETDTFTLTINVTSVNKAPVIYNKEVNLIDSATNGTGVANMTATDREGNTLTYSITAGNLDSTFSINSSTGVVSVADHTKLNQLLVPRYDLTINVSDGTNNSTATLAIIMLHNADVPPKTHDTTFDILDTQPTGSVIGKITAADYAEGETIVYTLVSESVPGVFTFNTTTLEISLVNNSYLNPAIHSSYTLILSAWDGVIGHDPVNFTVTINVKYDRASLAFEPSNESCIGTGSTCAPGYTLSDDGTICTKTTTVAADSSGGSGTQLQHYSYWQYGFWGTIIYPIGTYGTDGAPTVKANTTLVNSTAPIYPYKPGGEASVINSLWVNPLTSDPGTVAQDGSTGRLNRIGVWALGNQGLLGNLGFSRMINVPVAGNYMIGVGADDTATIKINGTTIVAQNLTAINTAFNSVYHSGVAGAADLFRYFHIYEVALNAGPNVISVIGNNTGGVGIIGVEVYKATAAQLIAATTETALASYIVFSSARSSFGSVDDGNLSDVGLYNCDSHPGYVLVYDPGTNAYVCKKVETNSPVHGSNTRHWTKVKVKDLKHAGSTITILNNQSSPVQTFQDVTVPYYPDVVNHIDCGGAVTLYLNAAKSNTAQKNDCSAGIGSVVKYTVPSGVYSSTVDQATADALAQADVDANTQTYANTNGKCN